MDTVPSLARARLVQAAAVGAIVLVAIIGILAFLPFHPPPGWQGADVHLVDHVWLGTETTCGEGQAQDDIECRRIVEYGVSFAQSYGVPIVKSALARRRRSSSLPRARAGRPVCRSES